MKLNEIVTELMIDRTKATTIRDSIIQQAEDQGIQLQWQMESGGVVVKRTGQIKMSFSLRDTDDVCLSNSIIVKDIIRQTLGADVKISVSNQLNTSRPEYKIIVTI